MCIDPVADDQFRYPVPVKIMQSEIYTVCIGAIFIIRVFQIFFSVYESPVSIAPIPFGLINNILNTIRIYLCTLFIRLERITAAYY